MQMTRFVLVHGAFHAGWCWYKVAARLEARGHRVAALDLPGHGRNAAAPASLSAYAEAVVEVLRREPEPAVLVGHSMGGAVITAAAEMAPDKVAKLVYLTAFLGPSGVSMSGALSASADGRPVIPFDERSLDVLYHDCPPEDVALARLCVTPQALEPLITPIVWTDERWGRVPRAFIGCLRDRVFAIAGQRARADAAPGTEFIELDCGHSPFFAMPEKLSETFETLAKRSGRP
jgi:pimeloyl-ACP methyl ester carboxylesterase